MVGLTRVELLAALYGRVTTQSLSLSQAQQTELVFRHELSSHFHVLPVESVILDRAMELVARHRLRANDAVQLAAALYVQSQYVAHGLPPLILVSSDQLLNQAALAEGLAVDDPNQHP
jgi:predicted nucleic acid-binding protein